MGGFDTLNYNKKDGIGCVTLSRPEVLNTYNIRMRDELFEVLSAIRDDDEVRVVIINGEGEKAFCAGADLSEFLSAPSPVAARNVRFERDVWGRFLSIPQPLIAALHGFVLGSGIEIALCCDIRIAAEDSRFGLPEVGLGIIPAAGGTQTLPRAVSTGKALELLLTDRWIDAHEACRIRLVNRVVPREKLFASTLIMARKIASHRRSAVRYAKQAIMRGMDMSLSQGLDLERTCAMKLKTTGAGPN